MGRCRQTALAIIGCVLCAFSVSRAADLTRPVPGSFRPGEDSPAAQAAPGGGVLLPLPFDGSRERVYWDITIPPPDSNATAIALDLTCDDPAVLRSITLHLQNDGHWLSAAAVLEGPGRRILRFQRADFAPANGNSDWQNASTLRLSAWKGASRSASLVVHSIRTQTCSVAILRGTERTAPGETALSARCAACAIRLFEKAGIPAGMLNDDIEQLDLRSFRLLVLPYNPTLTHPQLDLLDRFVKRGGRLAVFYHANTRLARMLDVHIEPFASQPENWTGVSFDAQAIPGLPAALPHRTQYLLPIRADGKSSVTLGAWISPDGIANPALPAAAVSPRGLWFSHIPPLASSSAVQWLLASLAHADPSYKPALEKFMADGRERDTAAAAMPHSPPGREGEIRAVWSPPMSSRLRAGTLRALADRDINAVFEQIATLADNLPENRLLQRHISRAVALAHANHIQLHAWIYTFNAEPFADHIPDLRKQDRLMQDAGGHALNWLCPLHEKNRKIISDTLDTLVRLGVDGIQFDYIRYPAGEGCYCPLHRAAFEKRSGIPLKNWPAEVLPAGPRAAEYEQFRASILSDFLAAETKRLRAAAPNLRLSAAVYPSPESAAENGQDWPAWLRGGILDFAAPMLYVEDPSRFGAMLDHVIAAAPTPSRILPGIGTGADESQLDALATAQQILIARQKNTGGFSLFQLDSELLSRILPPPPTPPK